MGELEVKSALEQWLVLNVRDQAVSKVPFDEDIITNRVVDSLRFADFILYIEELSGRLIDLETLDLAEVKTINAIYQSFFLRSRQQLDGVR